MGKDNAKVLLIGGLLVGGAIILGRKAGYASVPQPKGGDRVKLTVEPVVIKSGIKAPMKLSKNFDLMEFVNQHPGLKDYQLSQEQFDNISKLTTQILQPLRDKFGAVHVNSGLRPNEWRDANGKSLNDLLKEQGHKPAEDSDHNYGAAVDVSLTGTTDPARAYADAAVMVAKMPETRRVIVYYKTIDGKKVPGHMHISVVTPSKPKMLAADYAIAVLDGKRLGDIAYG